MKFGFITFDGMTLLDLVGFYDPITRVKSMNIDPNVCWDFCALKEYIEDDRGFVFKTKIVKDLSSYDVIFIPGGFSTRVLQFDEIFLSWIKTSSDKAVKMSVCSGSLILGGASFLNGISATTHPKAYSELEKYCKVIKSKIVDEEQVITAGGVTSSIDLALYVIEKFFGASAKNQIKLQIDYNL